MAADIGDRLRDLRAVMGWTQDDLAREVVRRSNAVSEWERGTRKPPRSVLTRLAEKYGWPVTMFEEGGPMPRTVAQRPLTGKTAEEATSGPGYPSYAVSAAERAYLDATREVRGYEERGELVPPRVALHLLLRVFVAGPTPAGAGDPFRRAAERARQVLPPTEADSEGKDVG